TGSDQVVHVSNAQNGVEYTAYNGNNQISGKYVATDSTVNVYLKRDNLAIGTNSVTIVASSLGNCAASKQELVSFEVAMISEILSSQSAMHCLTGSVTLSASADMESRSYNWYNSDKVLINGQHEVMLTTPVLDETTNYYVSSVNKLGCEGALQAVTAKIVQYEPVIIEIEGNSLASSYPTGNQWYLDNEAIDGANGQMYQANTSGQYTVSVAIDGCVTTATLPLIVTGLERGAEISISVYPNPVIDILIVKTANNKQIRSSEITNSNGQVLGSLNLSGDKKSGNYDFKGLPSGIYFLRINTDGKTSELKVLKN
ncbi:MAG: T9SS type A sorting domain-containing protein, partial [Bacteroidota bacterium]